MAAEVCKVASAEIQSSSYRGTPLISQYVEHYFTARLNQQKY
jgi:hypothetical protein